MTDLDNSAVASDHEMESNTLIGSSCNNDETKAESKTKTKSSYLLYSVDDVPPWYLSVGLGFQHFLTAAGGIMAVPLIISRAICMNGDGVGVSEIISTMFFVAGLSTILQSSIGTRLPIVQGATAAFLMPVFALMAQPEWQCPYAQTDNFTLTTLPELGSSGHKEIWKSRLRVVSGSIMVGSIFQVFLGATGLVGYIIRFIGPLSICPTVLLISLSLTHVVEEFASKQWFISLTVAFLVALFSQYLKNVYIPFPGRKKRSGIPVFQLYPVILALGIGWLICYVLTVTEVFPSDSKQWGYEARTDIKLSVLLDAKWFRFPYPGQWGMPTVSFAGVIGIMTGVIASIIESLGDYSACAKLSGAPPLPVHAVNRGIMLEGFGCFLCGLWGSGAGTTSYSENVGAITLTKVGSRRVVFVAGIIMCILGCFGKFAALVVTIPDPVLGGVFIISLGMVASVGLSNLQYVDLGSSRNLFIIGTSIFFGLLFPTWIKNHLTNIDTGKTILDQIIRVLLSTNMFVGGCVGFILDNTIPGTAEERGMVTWNTYKHKDEDTNTYNTLSTYDLPFIQKYLNTWKWTELVPFCPTFKPGIWIARLRRKNEDTV